MFEQLNSIEYFRLCDRRGVEIDQRAFAKPRSNLRRWAVPHKLGQNIGVEDDHSEKSGGSRIGSRGDSSSSNPPRGANRRRTMSARLSLRLGWATSAERRISLASSSIERPLFAARILRRDLTLSSSCRMVKVAMLSMLALLSLCRQVPAT